MQSIWKTINVLLVIGILSIGVLLLGTMMPIPGNIKVKIVKSGSMEPTIRTGGIVVIKPEPAYHVGDVVTFGADTKTQIPTTHRIIEMGDAGGVTMITTKGDANNAADSKATSIREVHGKVVFTVPYIGYLLDFARKPIGFALLVGLPAIAVIVDEIGKIVAEVRRLRRKKRGDEPEDARIVPSLPVRPAPLAPSRVRTVPTGLAAWPDREVRSGPSPMSIERAPRGATETRTLPLSLRALSALLLPVVLLSAISSVGSTVSYFADQERAIGNFLKADPLGFTVSVSPSSQVDMSAPEELSLALVPDADSEPIVYSISTLMTGGDTTLCALAEVATSSPASSFLLFAQSETTSLDPVTLRFSLAPGYAATENTSCFFDLIYVGRNANAAPGSGYTLTRHVPIQLFIPASAPVPAAPAFFAPVVAAPSGAVDATDTPLDPTKEDITASDTPPTIDELAPPAPTASSSPEEASPDASDTPESEATEGTGG